MSEEIVKLTSDAEIDEAYIAKYHETTMLTFSSEPIVVELKNKFFSESKKAILVARRNRNSDGITTEHVTWYTVEEFDTKFTFIDYV